MPHGTFHAIYRFLHDNDSFPLAFNRAIQDIVQLRREEECAGGHDSVSFGLMQSSKEQAAPELLDGRLQSGVHGKTLIVLAPSRAPE